MKLNVGWVAARESDVAQTGQELTTSHVPSAKSKGWMEAVVPGTVLTTLLKNNAIEDPFYGLNNEKIPDIADAGREYYTFWFCNRVNLPIVSGKGKAWLTFRAINYSAEVFVNGHSKVLPGGMFLRHTLDITHWLNQDGLNFLAVLVHPPDHPGRIPPEGGQGGDHDIAKDVAAQYVEGWDWICPIRDRNTGIWDEVTISFTGPVKISDPHLVATFYDEYTRIYLDASLELINTSSASASCTITLQVSLDVEGDLCIVDHVVIEDVLIEGSTTILHSFRPLFFYKPKLWWPNQMGEQPLYKVDIVVDTDGHGESDSWTHPFGFRHIHTSIDPLTGGRKFQVNGEPVFIRGGNWIVSDGLLRLSEDRYNTDVGFHADMNLNMMRVWGGGLAERPEFYRACDKRGILVWQEFWITGDCDGRGVAPSDPNWPLDHNLFLTCARDTVKLLRNYASLALWVGGNEQYPAADINSALTSELQLNPSFQVSGALSGADLDTTIMPSERNPSHDLDGTRVYIPGSLWSGFAAGNGAFTDGPYGIQNPENFFQDGYYTYAFNPEIGSVGVPVAATIRATMQPDAWDPPQLVEGEGGYVTEVPNATWDYHKYISYSDPANLLPHQIASYGKPVNLDDFCEKAQLVNYTQYRALIESWNSRMWTHYTGLLIWKTQNPWPGLRGQMYDHLLDQTGAFFGVRCAAEPIHVQLNLVTYSVEIINTTKNVLSNLTVEATVYDLDGSCPYHTTFKQKVAPPYKTVSVGEVGYHKLENAQHLYFVLLKLLDSLGDQVSRNFYWLHLPGGSYSRLEGEFQRKRVPVKTHAKASLTGKVCDISIRIENLVQSVGVTESKRAAAGLGVAFWLHFTVLASNTLSQDKRILPVTYSDNFFSLAPGETISVRVSFQLDADTEPKLLLQGWNITDMDIPFKLEKNYDQPS